MPSPTQRHKRSTEKRTRSHAQTLQCTPTKRFPVTAQRADPVRGRKASAHPLGSPSFRRGRRSRCVRARARAAARGLAQRTECGAQAQLCKPTRRLKSSLALPLRDAPAQAFRLGRRPASGRESHTRLLPAPRRPLPAPPLVGLARPFPPAPWGGGLVPPDRAPRVPPHKGAGGKPLARRPPASIERRSFLSSACVYARARSRLPRTPLACAGDPSLAAPVCRSASPSRWRRSSSSSTPIPVSVRFAHKEREARQRRRTRAGHHGQAGQGLSTRLEGGEAVRWSGRGTAWG